MLFSIDCEMTDEAIDNEIWKVWQWCSDTYLQYGIKIAFPANTEPKKTYQWRYASGIVKKFREWEFEEDTAKMFIQIAVVQAKRKGILKKGLAALHQNNLLDMCYKIVIKQNKEQVSIVDSLTTMKKFYDTKIGSKEPLEVLLHRASPRALTNITQWYQSNLISDLFIALSKNCCRAVVKLDKTIDTQLLPEQTSLYMLRQDFISDEGNSQKALRIFCNDWRDR